MSTRLAGALAVALVASTAAVAQAPEPPVTGPQDAACREEAMAKVLTTPDTTGKGVFEMGKKIYLECMHRTGGKIPKQGE